MLTEKQRRWLQKVLDADPGALPEGDDEASVRKRYQARRRQLDPALGSLDDYLQSSQLKSAAAPVRAAAKVYNTERKAVDDAAQKKDFKTAEKALARLETAVSNLTRAAGDRLARNTAENTSFDQRKRYWTRWDANKDKFTEINTRNLEQPYSGKGAAAASAWQRFSDANGRRFSAEMRKDYGSANDALDEQLAELPLLDPPPGPIDRLKARRGAMAAQAHELQAGIQAGAYPGLNAESKTLGVRIGQDLPAAKTAIDQDDAPTGNTALDRLEQAIATFRAAAAAKLLASTTGSKSAGLAQAKAMIEHDPDALRVLMAEPGGKEAIDRMMESMGSKASSAQDKKFVKAAILARFDMTALSGDLTTKALPRLFNVLKNVPDTHTLANPKLQKIERNRGSEKDSTYWQTVLTLNTGKSGSSKQELDQDADVAPKAKLKPGKVNTFDHTTLHELGHSIDDAEGLMEGAGKAHADWQVHSIDDVADIAGTVKGFYAAYEASAPRGFLRELLKSTLAGVPWDQASADLKDLNLADRMVPARPDAATILAHPAVRQAQTDYQRLRADARNAEWDEPLARNLCRDLRGTVAANDPNVKVVCAVINRILIEQVAAKTAVDDVLARLAVVPDGQDRIDVDQMKAHAAVDWCGAILDVPKEMWQKYKTDPARFKAGNRVYFKDRNNWRSYALAARSVGVSQYQFKSPAEWFAELYAALHTGKLPASHPHHDWLANNYGQPAT